MVVISAFWVICTKVPSRLSSMISFYLVKVLNWNEAVGFVWMGFLMPGRRKANSFSPSTDVLLKAFKILRV